MATGGDGSEGFVVLGDDGQLGDALADAGDVNGDGINDLLVGDTAYSNRGGTYVIFGRGTPFDATFEVASLHPDNGGDGSSGFIVRGTDELDRLGYAVSGAGDVNGDGVDDLIIGARYADPHGKTSAGESYVLFGRMGRFPPIFPLMRLFPGTGGDGAKGFVLKGIDTSDVSGQEVGGVGDVNADGIADVIIGAARADPRDQSSAGESYVVFGSASGFPAAIELRSLFPRAGGDGTAGFVLTGGEDINVGYSHGTGDFNGDGIADMINGGLERASVVFGRVRGFPAVFPLHRLLPDAGGDGRAGFVLQGHSAHRDLTVADAGDINGDGIDDMIIGWDQDAGETYVVFGRRDGFPPVFELSTLANGDGSEGLVLVGAFSDEGSGWRVAGGDINGDGIDDIVTSAAFPAPDVSDGRVYVVFGKTSGFPPVIRLSSLDDGDGSTGFVLEGQYHAGNEVSSVADINGDAIDDLVIAEYLWDRSFVVFGRTSGFPPLFELRDLLP